MSASSTGRPRAERAATDRIARNPLPAWGVRGAAVLVLASAGALPWVAQWRGVLDPVPEGVEGVVVGGGETVVLRPELMRLPGGRFMMGSDSGNDDEKPVHEAVVAPFEICRTEVTQGQWTAVMGTTPFRNDGGIGDVRPAHSISWEMAVEYLVELTKRENELRKSEDEALTQCYEKVEGQWSWTNRECTGYRLPTETEWEYATRAGTQTEYSFGDDVAELGKYGWFGEGIDGQTHPVAELRPNPWGLYDVHGNVWEWVWDWYREEGYEAEATATGYAGPVTGEYRVLRGGSFRLIAVVLRSAFRNWDRPTITVRNSGFRCVRGLGPEPSTP